MRRVRIFTALAFLGSSKAMENILTSAIPRATEPDDSFPLKKLSLTTDPGPKALLKDSNIREAITACLKEFKNIPSHYEPLCHELALLCMYGPLTSYERQFLLKYGHVSLGALSRMLQRLKDQFPETVMLLRINFVSFPAISLMKIFKMFKTKTIVLCGSTGIGPKEIEMVGTRWMKCLDIARMGLDRLPCLTRYENLETLEADGNELTYISGDDYFISGDDYFISGDDYFQDGKYHIMPTVTTLDVLGTKLASVGLNLCVVFPNATLFVTHPLYVGKDDAMYHPEWSCPMKLRRVIQTKGQLESVGIAVLYKRRPKSSRTTRRKRPLPRII